MRSCSPGQPALARYLFRRTKPNEWRTVHGNVCVTGSFADLLRALIGSTRAVPLVDLQRVQQQQVDRPLQERTRQVLQFATAYDDVDVWRAVARVDALAALDPVHNDVDGVSMALEPYYFGGEIDALGAAALLAGRPATTFLARLGGAERTQVVVSAVRASGQVGHVLMEQGSLCRPTIRDSIQAMPQFRLPLTRRAVEREFVTCTIRFAEQSLGAGVTSVVMRGRLNDTIDVAVKRLKAQASDKDLLFAEADAMLKMAPHRNVACLYGLVVEPAALVLEFCDGGSLDQVLGLENSTTVRVFNDGECELLALGIARGMAQRAAAARAGARAKSERLWHVARGRRRQRADDDADRPAQVAGARTVSRHAAPILVQVVVRRAA